MSHVGEATLRENLAEIDRLRAEANLCERMHTHWMGHDGELVEIQPVIVRRRWREDQQTHSERVMTRDEMHLFRSWLCDRRDELNTEAAALSAALGGDER